MKGWSKKVQGIKKYENLPREAKDYLKEWRASSLALVKILIDEDKYWLPKGIKNYETLLLLSLEEAINEVKKITKTNDPLKWQWGKYHKLTFEHPFSKALPILGPILNVGPIEVGGDKDTISAFGTNNNLKAIWGPSARVVIDLKNLNDAHVQIPLGTSSQIGSSYFKDQTTGWLENKDIPFVYDESKVIRSAKDLLVLKPQ
jgi:penicillin amidase